MSAAGATRASKGREFRGRIEIGAGGGHRNRDRRAAFQQLARAAIAAQAQGKFWEMHDVLFANGAHLERDDLDNYAKGLQLDIDKFQADFDSAATTDRIKQDRELADALKIRGTPSVFLNGRQYDGRGGTLDEWISTELSKQ